ncbi:MAG: glucose PTS transporter subunit IIA [Atopobium sp.]|uniref:glucose PTS transporter subunit IIA n=1 Tax=Atopobium sp. TaxID=1872650 RepID=UPI002A7FB1A2|nr:glucose PTS transporter subunit IIA [Atopobium sp.]MDY4523144.1 glucose PTS transporter subunit IIA [Atopobium sp.]
MAADKSQTPQAILDAVGGADNIVSFTCCATRLRFELKDASNVDAAAIEQLPGVLGTVPQSGNRFQVIIGGAVQTMYNQISNLPEMKKMGGKSNADVKSEYRAKTQGKSAFIDSFFEYLSDSFRPILGVLLGASLIIAFAAMMEALGVQAFNNVDSKPGGWVFIDAMWRAVLYFLPVMIAYNASKKLEIDPWLGATIMLAVMTPNFVSLSSNYDTTSVTNATLGTTSYVANIFGLPMQLNDYGGQVFVPLIMVAVLALVYRGLKKIFPENVQMVFVPFFSMIVMIPLTAFIIGPISIWLGSGIGAGLAWLNTTAPFVFAIVIPLIYPFLVPLGLHWPLNALMLVNINTLGYDFIQGPMGAWNFACFGATAGVLFIAMKDRDSAMRQTATGALAAGLLGGISEPSLYGIHLRYKRIYPRMLVGCAVGGIVIGLLGLSSNGVHTSAFAFTSLLTIPAFTPMSTYAIALAAAFFTSMILVIVSDYRTPEQRAEFYAARDEAEAAAAAVSTPAVEKPHQVAAAAATTSASAVTKGSTCNVIAAVPGKVVALDAVNDKVFASRALGEGVGIVPQSGTIVAPVAGTVSVVQKAGHAFGINTADGLELLVHVGIDTVELEGKGFEPKVSVGQKVAAGDTLVVADLDAIASAGYDTTTLVVVTNTQDFSSVKPLTDFDATATSPIIEVTK